MKLKFNCSKHGEVVSKFIHKFTDIQTGSVWHYTHCMYISRCDGVCYTAAGGHKGGLGPGV